MVFFGIEMWKSGREKLAGGATLGVFLVSGLLGIVNGFGFPEGVLEQVNFLTFDPLTGLGYEDAASWALKVVPLYFLPLFAVGLFRLLCGIMNTRYVNRD